MTPFEQPNGVIIYVNYPDREVMVKFFDGKFGSYSFDDLEGNWTDALGGTYLLYKPRSFSEIIG
jgi:hypothetical protein